MQLLISPTTRGNAGDSPFRGIFQSTGNVGHHHYILCSIETVLSINGRKLVEIVSSSSDGGNNKHKLKLERSLLCR